MKFVSPGRAQAATCARHAERKAIRFLTRGRPGALVLGIAAAAAVAVPASASATTGASPVIGHVYANDNTKGTNTIGAFDRHADGSLTPVPGSPFVAGGAGTGSGLASQGAIQITQDGRFLIAVDAGSNQVSVLRIHFHGSLSLVPGGVVSSGGTLPDSIAVHGNLVYVANSGNGGSNYTGFRLGFDGRLVPIPGSTVPLAANAAPGDVLFNGTGTKLAGTVEQHIARLGAVGQREGRPGDRVQAAVGTEPEAGVVAAAVTGVGHVHQVTGDRDADRQDAAGGDDAVAYELEGAVGPDPQHRDLVAAGIGGDKEPAIGRQLQRALRGQPGAAGRERGPGPWGQRAVRVPVKRPDRVDPCRVVVDIDVPDHRGSIGRGGGGGGCGDRYGCGHRQAEDQRTRPAAVQEARGSSCCGPGRDGCLPAPT